MPLKISFLFLFYFFNIQLKRQGGDLETKIEELRDINQSLRKKDKMKEDGITNLSDKLL